MTYRWQTHDTIVYNDQKLSNDDQYDDALMNDNEKLNTKKMSRNAVRDKGSDSEPNIHSSAIPSKFSRRIKPAAVHNNPLSVDNMDIDGRLLSRLRVKRRRPNKPLCLRMFDLGSLPQRSGARAQL